jgi:hypothetical protein
MSKRAEPFPRGTRVQTLPTYGGTVPGRVGIVVSRGRRNDGSVRVRFRGRLRAESYPAWNLRHRHD